jgi:ACS family D-galactonate transporter-like MFS transporter
VRKWVLVGGMIFGLAVFGATLTRNPGWAIFWISIALGGLAASAPVGWSIPSLIAPKGSVGTIGGIMNFVNNLMGAVAPTVTGLIVGATASFTNAFIAAGAILLIGIFFYVVVLGKIEPIPTPSCAARRSRSRRVTIAAPPSSRPRETAVAGRNPSTGGALPGAWRSCPD